ncbi:replication protein A 32 kDa subunit B isoform X2 [Mercurialis annua]|uniref:replication protein A 32 kDa subunit B isoform X2 n=1 Tax=Mercurialis annua TaxID=3986 RepID=UPI00215FE0B7|nr:replication protein A 32 kDa subunit B isoform X2 [Mercurialis annua]
MYRSNEFDGSAAAFMGGGFMPSQATQPSDSSSSFPNSRNRDSRCLLPLTVKTILELQSNDESNFVIDGVEVSTVTIVGRVSLKEDKASEYTFLVDDGTGQIECIRWVQERIDTEEVEGITVGKYVRIHGHLRGLQGRRFLNAFSIRPITDFNEITSHFIECIYVHFYNTRIRGAAPQAQLPSSTMGTSLKGYQTAPQDHSSTFFSIEGVNSPTGQMIMRFLLQPMYAANEDGVNRNLIARQLNIPMDKLMEELQALIDNGSVYSTIDEDHFKSTANG